MWERLAIVPDFTVQKHQGAQIRARFPGRAYYHVGDTDVDAHYAVTAGFQFLRADRDGYAAWGAELFGG